MKRLYRIIIFAVSVLAAAPTYSLDTEALERQLAPLLHAFDLARQGQGDAVENALSGFEELLRQYPDFPLLEAYAGSLVTMQARDALAAWNKMRYAERGLDRIDRALESLSAEHERVRVRGVPVALDVRLTAAATFVNMPRFFNRRGQAERLLRGVVDASSFSTTPVAFQIEVWQTRARLAGLDDRPQDQRIWSQNADALAGGAK